MMGKSQFIRYDGSENEQHRNGKNRVMLLLIPRGWRLITNSINGEYRFPPLENGHSYKLDSYFKSPNRKHYGFEYDGKYHFASRRSMQKMDEKDTWVRAFFKKRMIDIILIHFTVEEMVSRLKMEDWEILRDIEKGIDRKTF